jgi:hypothetical protein
MQVASPVFPSKSHVPPLALTRIDPVGEVLARQLPANDFRNPLDLRSFDAEPSRLPPALTLNGNGNGNGTRAHSPPLPDVRGVRDAPDGHLIF